MTRAAIASAGGTVTREIDDCVTSNKHMLDSATTLPAAH